MAYDMLTITFEDIINKKKVTMYNLQYVVRGDKNYIFTDLVFIISDLATFNEIFNQLSGDVVYNITLDDRKNLLQFKDMFLKEIYVDPVDKYFNITFHHTISGE